MRTSDQETLSIAAVVSDVVEGKKATEEAKYPHKMYDPKTGEEVSVKDEEEHEKYNKLGWVHDKPKMESPEEPRAQGEKDFKDKHTVKKSGAKADGTIVKEESIEEAAGKYTKRGDKEKYQWGDINKAMTAAGMNARDILSVLGKLSGKSLKEESIEEAADVDEASEKQKKYQAFFQKALKKYGVKSPAELDKEKRKDFFDYVDKNYEAENETD